MAATLLTPPTTPDFDKGAFDTNVLFPRSTETRALSDNELSYYLPARAEGVNDMYLHHTFTASPRLVSYTRVLHIWAYQLLRHPLLASTVFTSGYSARFVCERPATLQQALAQASARFKFVSNSNAIVDDYLNGPRTLGDATLSTLVLSAPAFLTPPLSPGRDGEEGPKYELMLCATHFIGDGMALHTFMNEFYTLLGSDASVHDLEDMIERQLYTTVPLPSGIEERLVQSKWKDVAGSVALTQAEARLVGGQSFPTARAPRRTVVPTFAYTEAETKRILSRCKERGVTIAHVVFALCNIAWSRLNNTPAEPCMMYSALNLRPTVPSTDSFFHLAVGYFNIVLPSLLPAIPAADLLWHRAKMTKAQTIKAVKSPFVASSNREMSRVRRDRALRWAAIDDGLEPPAPTKPAQVPAGPPAKPLMGVSMLGNLDGMYRHADFPAVKLQTLMTGSRQRSSGLLLFAYTFNSRLWLSLGYDVNGFKEGVIEAFWQEVQTLVDETLLC